MLIPAVLTLTLHKSHFWPIGVVSRILLFTLTDHVSNNRSL